MAQIDRLERIQRKGVKWILNETITTRIYNSYIVRVPLVDPKFDANKSMQSLLDDFDFTVDDIEEAFI